MYAFILNDVRVITTMCLRALFVVFTFLVVLTELTASYPLTCPHNCDCLLNSTNLHVNCANRNLKEFPILDDLPVVYLDLSGNQFTEFPTEYTNIKTLIYLDLSDNQISYLDSYALDGYASLQTLLLNNNSFKSWANINANEVLQHAQSLERLSLNGNSLETFTADLLEIRLRSTTLIELELKACNIKSVGGVTLLESLPKLQRLVLSDNNLKGMFSMPSESLRYLELKNCNLHEIGENFLTGIPKLQGIDLSWNTELILPPVIIKDLTNLQFIDLSHCNLVKIELGSFPMLKTALLSGNMLSTIYSKMFIDNAVLEVLDLSKNLIRTIGSDTFKYLKRLTVLDLSNNAIAQLDKNLFSASDALVSVNLQGNILGKFSIIRSNSIEELNLSGCEITSIDSLAFSSLYAIKKLNLSHNFIQNLPLALQSKTLQILDLSNCRISTIGYYTFRILPALISLHLNRNHLDNPIPPKFFIANQNLQQIWLGNNLWMCDCKDNDLRQLYVYLTTEPAKLQDKSNLKCTLPTLLYGKTWETACSVQWHTYKDKTGETRRLQISITILTVSIVLLIIGVGRIIKYCRRCRAENEYHSNEAELQEIQTLNTRILQQPATASNAPRSTEIDLPSYEDALQMPRLQRNRNSYSMVDISNRNRAHKKQLENVGTREQDEIGIQRDMRRKYLSFEVISNRRVERTTQYSAFNSRGWDEYGFKSDRHIAAEAESRFPASYLKFQNLQSAEKLTHLISYEASPYAKRKTTDLGPSSSNHHNSDETNRVVKNEEEDNTSINQHSSMDYMEHH